MSHPVLDALRSESAGARRGACERAAEDPSAVLLVDALCEALGDADPGVARAAGTALQRIAREHRDAQPSVLTALRAALRGESPRQRLEAAWTWARVEPPPIALLPAVAGALESADGDARWRAARLLVELGRLHGESVAVVYGLAGPEHPARVRRIALTALRELAPGEMPVLLAHLAACRDDDAGLRRLALAGLAGLGERSEAVWSALSDALEADGDPGARRVAARAVRALGDAPAELAAAAEAASLGD